MIIDSYEAHPQLLARWRGGEDLKKAVIASFKYGECRQIIERLERQMISIDNAVDQLSKTMDKIHKEVH